MTIERAPTLVQHAVVRRVTTTHEHVIDNAGAPARRHKYKLVGVYNNERQARSIANAHNKSCKGMLNVLFLVKLVKDGKIELER